jgi:hypothetical protein
MNPEHAGTLGDNWNSLLPWLQGIASLSALQENTPAKLLSLKKPVTRGSTSLIGLEP